MLAMIDVREENRRNEFRLQRYAMKAYGRTLGQAACVTGGRLALIS